MPKDRKFVNPLYQSSEEAKVEETAETSLEGNTLPSTSRNTSTEPYTFTPTLTETYTSTYSHSQQRKRGTQAFEKTHERITLWIDKGLKQQLDALSNDEGIAKSTLLNEAVADLLKKHNR